MLSSGLVSLSDLNGKMVSEFKRGRLAEISLMEFHLLNFSGCLPFVQLFYYILSCKTACAFVGFSFLRELVENICFSIP